MTAGQREKEDTRAPGVGYRWTCPFCDTSRVKRSNGQEARTNAIVALHGHIQASDGGGHGSRYQLPLDEMPDLSEHVTRVDCPGDSGK